MDTNWWPLSLLPDSVRGRGRRSFFFVGFVAGISISLGSLATALVLAEVRAKRKRRRRRQLSARGSSSKREATSRRGRGDPHHQGHASHRRGELIDIRAGQTVRGVDGLIGNTPLVRINSLSELTGCEILGKAEWLNPGGSPKDRVAKQILDDAEDEGLLHPHTGSCVFEGTVGSTGISLATLARARGYRCSIVIPDDVASEKVELLRKLGAEIDAVRPRGIVDPRHFVNEARTRAEQFGSTELIGPHAYDEGADAGVVPGWDGEKRDDLVLTTNAQIPDHDDHRSTDGTVDDMEKKPRGFFADQFENISNFYAHYHGTGPEIWRQTGGMIDAFVAGAGTGGTLSGVATYLKEEVARLNQSDSEDGHSMAGDTDNGHDDDEGGWFGLHFRDGPSKRVRARQARAAEDEGVPWRSRSAPATTARSDADRTLSVVLADPQGSGLFNKVKYGVMYNQTEAEGRRRRHQVDTVIEGIGLNRLTHNFELGLDYYDDAVSVTDEEAVRMSRHLVLHDGLFLGSSSAVNCVAAVRTALRLKKERRAALGLTGTVTRRVAAAAQKGGSALRGKSGIGPGLDDGAFSSKLQDANEDLGEPIVVVTILCDSGARHLSRFWNDDALRALGIEPADDISGILDDVDGDNIANATDGI